MKSISRSGRRQRSPLLDLRLAVGIALVAASVVGVWWVVQSARETFPVLAAASPIVPGQVISAGDVVEIEAQLGQAESLYLPPEALIDGLVATRSIGQGELIATAATGDITASDLTSVVVRSALEVPAGVSAGSTVELWAARLEAPGQYEEPLVIVSDAVVASVLADDGMVSREGTRLELVIGRGDVSVVLDHVAGGSALSAVPVHAGGTS
ncbi:SAF domain-containing protein [Microbacterium amylolyticum]|uniref:SAF domain-containing protein n=1 Tax=Microbacterium amylolyticum TaxID=936337 RepID=A0ABS4ZJZ5_9MICO|nr:SAF domain-containing protein [Microbacterium amylolyticum]MBP2437607.1 hypothetical protein [Microbacterium amylolyticum]